MNLAQIKKTTDSKRRLFQIERAVVREITDLWCREKAYFDCDFADDVEVRYHGSRIGVTFINRERMKQGSPEATINDMMRGLILTMATDQQTGRLLRSHKAIIGNILDVFVHRLKEIEQSKFIFQRLQSLEVGFRTAFGLDASFDSIKRDRRLLEDMLTVASLSTADETVDTLVHDMRQTEFALNRERGVTFHIVMESPKEASFVSLPLGMEQASFISLLGTHTLRCNIIADLHGQAAITAGIMKLDAPSNPIHFLRHKGFSLQLGKETLMKKLRSNARQGARGFSAAELVFLKLIYNEYVQLACFLLSSKRIDPNLKLLIIFPRANIFSILHSENPAIPADEPQTLGELAALKNTRFPVQKLLGKNRARPSKRIPEKIIQEKILETLQAISRNIIRNIYKPVSTIKREVHYYAAHGFSSHEHVSRARSTAKELSAYIKKFSGLKRVVVHPESGALDIEASCVAHEKSDNISALEEIVRDIQASEVEQVRDVVVSKMLGYLSDLTVNLEQIQKVATPFIKEEIAAEIDAASTRVLNQMKAAYRLVMGSPARTRK